LFNRVTKLFPLFFGAEYGTLIETKKEEMQKKKRRKEATVMDYMKYITIQVIKKSERSEVVFAAMDEMDVPVVVKRLQGANPEIYREIAKIRNPHIPRIYCVEEQGDELCVAEEYIDGRTLDVYLAEETLTDLRKLGLMVQLCEALEALHQCNPPVIHRDIKPSNILITTDGVLKIIDFDASRQYKEEKDTGDTRLLGTIEYAAPEQFGYSQTDERSDIYSAGVVFSEIKIGKEASFAGALKRLIDKCTSFDPENRYKDVSELKRGLEKCIRKGMSRGRKKWVIPLAAVAILLGMLFVGRIQMQREQGEYKEAGLNPTGTSVPEADRTEEANGNTPAAIKDVEEEKTGEKTLTYKMSDLTYWNSYYLDYEYGEDGSLFVRYDELYAEIMYCLPAEIDMSKCVRVEAKVKSEAGKLAIKLYDSAFNEMDVYYGIKTMGMQNKVLNYSTEETIAGIGIMTCDKELTDYSQCEARIESITFYMEEPESKFVTKPEEVTEWYIPPIRKGYIDDSGEYKIGKRVVGDRTEKAGYAFDKLKYKDSRDVSWKLKDNAAITMDFDKIYGQLVLELPVVVDMEYCNRLVVWAENEIGDIVIVLYNEDYEELEHLYLDKTEGAGEFSFYPKTKEKVEYIGFMANDGELADYSGFETIINYVDFYMVNPENAKISYDMADLKVENYYYLNSIRWDEEGEGSVHLNYNRVYGEMQLLLPEPVDMRLCDGVSVVMNTGGEPFTVKLFDEKFNELEYSHDHITNGMEEVMLDVWVTGKVYGIGLMLDEEDGGDGTKQRNSVVTVQSINFYMKDGYGQET